MDALDHTVYKRPGKKSKGKYRQAISDSDLSNDFKYDHQIKKSAQKMEEVRKQQRRMVGLI